MKYLIITVLIILILSILSCFILNRKKEGFMEINILDVKTENRILLVLRKMLHDVDNLFNAKGVKYWIDGGTLLGAVRHKDVIPWDDDVDICVPYEYKEKMLSLESWLNNMGYGLSEFWGGYKIYPLNGVDIKFYNRNWKWGEEVKELMDKETFNYKYPFIDVFFVSDFGDTYDFTSKYVKRVYPNYWHLKEDLFPLKRYRFADFTVWGPKNPKPYLDRAYGSDWMTVGYKKYDHENQRILPLTKFKVTPTREDKI